MWTQHQRGRARAEATSTIILEQATSFSRSLLVSLFPLQKERETSANNSIGNYVIEQRDSIWEAVEQNGDTIDDDDD